VSEMRSIVVERMMPYEPERVWRVLTDKAALQQWLMPNNFVAEVGHRFTFKTKPMGDWDGTVFCHVIACEPPHLLSYTWTGGSEKNEGYGSILNSTVTWTLVSVTGGTRLRMEHAGFVSPDNDFAYNAMNSGWSRIVERLETVVAGQPAPV